MRTYAASLLAAVLLLSAPALARSHSTTTHRTKTVHVKQYTKKSGQTVSSHQRSAPRK